MLSVVLADDENKILLLLQKLIDWESLGYEIAGTANDGLRALELVREKQPDLLITDVRMPGCSGIELIQRAKDLQPNLHFIIISGYRKFEYAQNALKYGVEDYLLKPIKQDDLIGILLRLKDKLGEEAALEFRLKKSGERQQELLMASLADVSEHQQSFIAYADKRFHSSGGICFAALVRVDMTDAAWTPGSYQIILRYALEIVRRELHALTDVYAAAVRKEGVAIVLRMSAYRTVAVKQCFTKIQKEVEQHRDMFGNLRCTISNVQEYVTFSDELDNAENYFTIQRCRFGDKISMELDMEDEKLLEARMPKLILQPLVENAVAHGLEGKLGYGTVRIVVENSDRTLFLRVRDDGVGIPDRQVERLNQQFAGDASTAAGQQRGGIALRNVNSRIRLIFGEDYGLRIFSVEGIGTECCVTLPLLFQEE